MGKRLRRGGGGSGRSLFSSSPMEQSILIRRIYSLKLSFSSDPDFISQSLRERYPDYARVKLQPFSTRLRKVLEHLRDKYNTTPAADDTSQPSFSGGGTDEERPSRKKHNREDVLEESLLHAESEHLRRWQRTNVSFSSPSKSSDDSTSTSDDAAFNDNIEPEFDITKSMLREKYVKQADQRNKEADKEKIVEVETVTDDKRKIASLMKQGDVIRKDVSVLGPKVGRSDFQSEAVPGVSGRGPMFHDIGGMKRIIEELLLEVIVPLFHPVLPKQLGVRPISGILLHGPPGCGKTKLAHAIANETGVQFYKISATEVVSGVSGASEENIRNLFNKAYRTAPSIVFIDEIDAIASKRENSQREMERRIVTQLMTCMDDPRQSFRSVDTDSDLEAINKPEDMPGYVLVIGATNRPDAVELGLRRPGRFDKEIALGVPDENARAEILFVLTRNCRLEGDFDLSMIARLTPGFVGADLEALVNRAGNLAMKRIVDKRRSELTAVYSEENIEWLKHPWPPEEIESLSITMFDFKEAIKLVQPSTRREGFSSIPNIKWKDVGGLDSLRKEFNRYIVQRIKNPKYYKHFGIGMEVGFLLYGPPGCGKTLIAKALANEAGANFIHIKGSEILNKYVGESEQEVRRIFTRARTCSPCILFFDEIDALTAKRGREGAHVGDNVLNQLLAELDGTDQQNGVYVLGATNRPEIIDAALVRPGRFERLFYVPLPTAEERGLILKALVRNKPVSPDVDYDALANCKACKNFTGADLAALVNEAAMAVIDELGVCAGQENANVEPPMITTAHFEKAFENIAPSVSEEQRRYYDALSLKLRSIMK